MKTVFLSIYLIISSFVLFAQNFTQKFGTITQEEIAMKNYAKDKSAEALVLFDVGQSYFSRIDYTFDVIFERTTRIKIFSDAGQKWANIEIPLYQEGTIYEKIEAIEAYTYNFENGQLVKTALNIKDNFVEKINEVWSVKKYTMPNVKAGSIIEYKYKVSSQYLFNLRDWEFQKQIPVVYSQYTVNMVPFYSYSWILQGTQKFDDYKTYEKEGSGGVYGSKTGHQELKFNDVVHQFVMKDVPAFTSEEFITSIKDYIIKIDFQLEKYTRLDGVSTDVITTWEDLIKDFSKYKDFGVYQKKCKKIASKLINIDSLKTKSADERFNFVMNYIKSNYTWNQINSRYAYKNPSEITDAKTGNSAEINLLAAGLLNACDIEAYPVLISTRKNGRIYYDYPFEHFFNYVVILAKIDGKNILTDATEISCSNYRIPPRAINDKGLVIDNKKVKWISLQSPVLSEIQTKISINFNGMDLKANVEKTADEYWALSHRNSFAEDKEKIEKHLISKNYTLENNSITFENHTQLEKPYIIKFTVSYKTDNINTKIYFQPFLRESIAENPLKQSERNYPIDLIFSQKQSYESTINIPDGYQVDFVSPDYKFSNALCDINYSTQQVDRILTVRFDYTLKNAIYSAKEYTKIRAYYDEIVKRGTEKIVLSKI